MSTTIRSLPAAITLALSFPAAALSDPSETDRAPALLDTVTVEAIRPDSIASESRGTREITPQRATTSDTASLLRDVPGASVNEAGGVSGLPVLHGFADDRLNVQVNGVPLISACSNHMNPPLSYIDPTAVEEITVYPGIAPVSVGGDSIGGAILVRPRIPRFADSSTALLTSGEAGAFFRSNGNGWGGHIAATLASQNLSAQYTGSVAESTNYHAARAFKPDATIAGTLPGSTFIAGDVVGSSAYHSGNQAIDLAYRHDAQRIELHLAYQHIPWQGFPNQHMDMTDNKGRQGSVRYLGKFAWGSLDAQAYVERTTHAMNFGDDKLFWYTAPFVPCTPAGPMCVVGMPMATEGRNSGARLQARIAAADSDELRIGTEYQRYRLDDRWAPSGGMMMWPNTFVNINDGQRDHADLYVELESRWTSRWSTIAGVRGTRVTMNAGSVQGYSSMYAMAPAGYNANTFNTADRRRVDNNVDAALIGRYVSGHRTTFEVGVAQKTRSPNLYERYAWSGNGMAMTMNNWVNDGNGYVGNLALRPEVARTISATADWHDPGKAAHGAKLTLYYSRVADFIDATCANLPSCAAGQFNYLTLANQAAELYGADLSGFFRLGDASGPDGFFVRGTASYVRGRNTDTGDGLYNIMPANGRLSLEYENGAWHLSLENELVARKSKVSTVRTELDTGGYYLINLAASAEWHHVRFDLGVDNLFDRFYALPTGGAYIGQGRTMSLNGAGAAWGVAVPGPGRSLHAGLTVSF